MAHLWLPTPRQFPNQCFITGLSGRENGPYLEVDTSPGRPFIDPRTRKEGRMYWSFASWRTTVLHPDSPYLAILEAEVHKRTQELQDRINELEAKIARDPAIVAFERFHEMVQTRPPDPEPTVAERLVTVPEEPEGTPRPVAHRSRRPNR